MDSCSSRNNRDLLHRLWAFWLLWAVPWGWIIVTGLIGSRIARTIGWTAGFTVMGVACLVNARQCGRRHCFYTGPLFLLGAFSSLLFGLDILPLPRNGWNWILGVVITGNLLACCGVEPVLGKYARTNPRGKK